MTTTDLTEEPPDGTILATPDLTYAFSRNDPEAVAGNWDDRNWYPVNGDDDPINWSEMNALGVKWQRLYRQSDVDDRDAVIAQRMLAGIAEHTRAGVGATHFDPDEQSAGTVTDTTMWQVRWYVPTGDTVKVESYDFDNEAKARDVLAGVRTIAAWNWYWELREIHTVTTTRVYGHPRGEAVYQAPQEAK